MGRQHSRSIAIDRVDKKIEISHLRVHRSLWQHFIPSDNYTAAVNNYFLKLKHAILCYLFFYSHSSLHSAILAVAELLFL